MGSPSRQQRRAAKANRARKRSRDRGRSLAARPSDREQQRRRRLPSKPGWLWTVGGVLLGVSVVAGLENDTFQERMVRGAVHGKGATLISARDISVRESDVVGEPCVRGDRWEAEVLDSSGQRRTVAVCVRPFGTRVLG